MSDLAYVPATNVPYDLGPGDEPDDYWTTDPVGGRESASVNRACGCTRTPGVTDCLHDFERKFDLAAYGAAFRAWQQANPGWGLSWYAGPPAPRPEQFPRAG